VLRVIKAAQRLGFTLDEVADLLAVGRHRHSPTRGGRARDAALQERAQAKLAEVEDRIADLTTIRDNLRAALDAGCADLVECAGNECCPIPFETITTRLTHGAGPVRIGLGLRPTSTERHAAASRDSELASRRSVHDRRLAVWNDSPTGW
jgi:hypothetical protein